MSQNGRTSKRWIRKSIQPRIKVEELEILQSRPYTVVRARVTDPVTNLVVETVGFSKVSWPDEWDQVEGIRVARRKATNKAIEVMVEDLFNGEPLYTNQTHGVVFQEVA